MTTLNKSREQWQKVDPGLCAATNSAAATMYMIKDAKQDIEELHSINADLLEALEEMIAWANCVPGTYPGGYPGTKAAATISRAKGEQS